MGKTHRREPYPSKEERRQADAVAPKKKRHIKTPDEVWAEYEAQQQMQSQQIILKTQEEIIMNEQANATAAPAATPAPAVNTVTPVASAPVATPAPAQAPAPATTPAPHWSTTISGDTCKLVKQYIYKATLVKKLSFEQADELTDIIQKKETAFNSETEFCNYIKGLITELEKLEAASTVDVNNNNSNNNGGTTMENNNVNPAPVAPVATATAVPTEVPTAAPVKLSDFDTAAKAILIAGGVIIIGLVAYAIINGVMTHRRLSALEAANGSM